MIKSLFLWIIKVIIILTILILLGLSAEWFVKKREAQIFAKFDKVGLVKISGPIFESFDAIRKIRQFLRDDSIKAVVVRVDSPGGAVGPSQELFNFIRSVKEKPIVTSMGSVAASGGLYVAVAGRKVFAQPGTVTGSIGVIMQIPNVSELANKLGVKFETVKSGELKDVGNIFRPLTEPERNFLNESVKKIHEQFINDIAVARGIPKERVKSFADGRFLTGEEALTQGLIDGFGDIVYAAKVSLELAGIPDKEPLLIIPRDYTEIIREIFGTTIQKFLFYSLASYYVQ